MTEAAARQLALSFPYAEERPHFDRVAFKVAGKRGRIFCTLGSGTLNLKIAPRERLYQLLRDQPEVFIDLGGWTRMGFVGIRLSKVKEPLMSEPSGARRVAAARRCRAACRLISELLAEAWRRVASKRELAAFTESARDV